MVTEELWGEIITKPAEVALKLKALQKAHIIGYRLCPSPDGNLILQYRATEQEVDEMYFYYSELKAAYNDGIKGFVI